MLPRCLLLGTAWPSQDDRLRSGMKEYSQWPTFPQIYVGGEFYGGCDIAIATYQNGELKETLERAMME